MQPAVGGLLGREVGPDDLWRSLQTPAIPKFPKHFPKWLLSRSLYLPESIFKPHIPTLNLSMLVLKHICSIKITRIWFVSLNINHLMRFNYCLSLSLVFFCSDKQWWLLKKTQEIEYLYSTGNHLFKKGGNLENYSSQESHSSKVTYQLLHDSILGL